MAPTDQHHHTSNGFLVGKTATSHINLDTKEVCMGEITAKQAEVIAHHWGVLFDEMPGKITEMYVPCSGGQVYLAKENNE